MLTDAELSEVWAQCRDDTYGRIVKLLILTAQRREEVGAMIWAELDLERGTWTLDAARTKNDEDHVVPLAPAALSILAATPRRARRELADMVLPDFVFSSGEAGFSGWSAAKIALDERINAARKAAGNEQPMPAWRLHDLRRSAATRMGDALRVPPHIIESILNHKGGYRGGNQRHLQQGHLCARGPQRSVDVGRPHPNNHRWRRSEGHSDAARNQVPA